MDIVEIRQLVQAEHATGEANHQQIIGSVAM